MIFISGIPVKIPTSMLVSIRDMNAWILNFITSRNRIAIAARVMRKSSIVVIYLFFNNWPDAVWFRYFQYGVRCTSQRRQDINYLQINHYGASDTTSINFYYIEKVYYIGDIYIPNFTQ